jgi:hypothetical protein
VGKSFDGHVTFCVKILLSDMLRLPNISSRVDPVVTAGTI